MLTCGFGVSFVPFPAKLWEMPVASAKKLSRKPNHLELYDHSCLDN